PKASEYRNKAQYPIAKGKNGEYVIGFYAPKSHRVTEAAACPLAPKVFAEINEVLRELFKKESYSVYNEESCEGLLRHIYLRRGEVSGEILLTIVINGKELPGTDRLVKAITENFPSVVGILLNYNLENTNVILGEKYECLWGRDFIYDTLSGVELKITAPSFYQVNHASTELLYAKARELARLEKSDTLLDLFCGIGSIGLSMAEDAGELIGIEIVESAVECAKENAQRAGLKNAYFFTGDAAETENLLLRAEKALGRKIEPDVIILDPPRAGCDEKLISFAASLSPKRIVYISCNPTTLARDAKKFKENGYVCDTVYGFDLFPHTGHVESLVCLEK
ncbi:MAG: 23S rRNA (uracil(1939)-C(5))-methyltransferase RlmD, partial [Clostridia bacterium]|nr:23S rRNA (uracil(1939)-C(5))-methyltransferase RlmD [Clostridia bacterium]